jgi:hypothetical protein
VLSLAKSYELVTVGATLETASTLSVPLAAETATLNKDISIKAESKTAVDFLSILIENLSFFNIY